MSGQSNTKKSGGFRREETGKATGKPDGKSSGQEAAMRQTSKPKMTQQQQSGATVDDSKSRGKTTQQQQSGATVDDSKSKVGRPRLIPVKVRDRILGYMDKLNERSYGLLRTYAKGGSAKQTSGPSAKQHLLATHSPFWKILGNFQRIRPLVPIALHLRRLRATTLQLPRLLRPVRLHRRAQRRELNTSIA
jgi:hypothetical protein